jgi:hypothetical protein
LADSGLDADLNKEDMEDLYINEEDRKKLEQMPQLEREKELGRRYQE